MAETKTNGSNEVFDVVQEHIDILLSQGKDDLANSIATTLQSYAKSMEESIDDTKV